jgi:hypothetical protein
MIIGYYSFDSDLQYYLLAKTRQLQISPVSLTYLNRMVATFTSVETHNIWLVMFTKL